MLPPPKVILRVLLFVLILTAILFAPWPGAQSTYRRFFCWSGNVSFSRFLFWGDGSVRFVDPTNKAATEELPEWARRGMPRAEGVRDVAMALENRKVLNSVGFKRTSSWRVGYVPIAMFLAWALATPAPWKKRLKGLAIGLVLVHLFIFVRISLTLLQEFGNPEKLFHLFDLGPTGFRVVRSLEIVLHQDPTVSYVVPTFIWMLLMFRPSQWSEANESGVDSNEASPRA